MRPVATGRIESKVGDLAKHGELVNYRHDIIPRKAKNRYGFGRGDNFIIAMSIKGIELTS